MQWIECGVVFITGFVINCIRGFPDFEWVVGIGGLLYATGGFSPVAWLIPPRFRECLLRSHRWWPWDGIGAAYLGYNAGRAAYKRERKRMKGV